MAHLRSLRTALALIILAIAPLAFSEFQSAGQVLNEPAEARLWIEEQGSGDTSSASVPGQPTDDSDEPHISSPDEAFEYTAASYAEYFGVSMEEVRRALILQDEAGKLGETLMERERAFLGGLRIEHLPEFHIVISVLEGGEDRVRPYVEDSALRDVVQFEAVSRTLDQLLEDQAIAGRMAEQVGVEYYSVPVGQRIQLYTPDADELEGRLRDAGLTLPETVDIVEAPPPATMTATTPVVSTTVAPRDPSPPPTESAVSTPITTREAGAFVPDSYTTGLLIEEGGCQWLIWDFKGVRTGIIWPHGFMTDTEDGATVIRNGSGEVVGRVGERIEMRGGTIGENRFDSPCEADGYWIAGEPIYVLPADSPTPTAS